MSEEQDDSQKTEDPTPRRLQEARKRGQVALSRELNTWLMLLAGTLVVGAGSRPVMRALTGHLRAYIEHADRLPQVPGGFSVVLGDSFKDVIGILLVPFLALMAAAFIGPFVQIGPLFAPEAVKPALSKVSPLAGFKRLFSLRSLVELAKGLLKLAVVGAVSWLIIKPYYSALEHLVSVPVPVMLDEMLKLVIKLMIGILIVLAVVAAIDVVYQRLELYKKLRMTKQELRDEYKQAEGDPAVKARLRQLRFERARKRMMQSVPKADVVITNPTHYAVALQYDPDKMEAPTCVAKGVDALALRIRELARESNVTIYENPPLARVLYATVDVDDPVPPEHYKAVAEVISFVFRMKGKMGRPAGGGAG
jgi:flagellar biosynthetic protein FlhB